MVVPGLVREVMTHNVVTEPPGATVADAVERLRRDEVGSIVVTEGERVVGILTDDDFIDLLTTPTISTDEPVRSAMSAPVETIAESASVIEAAERLRERRIDQLPVLEGPVSRPHLCGGSRRISPPLSLRQVDDTPSESRRDWTYKYEDAAGTGIGIGDVVQFSKSVSESDTEAFVRISGDENPASS